MIRRWRNGRHTGLHLHLLLPLGVVVFVVVSIASARPAPDGSRSNGIHPDGTYEGEALITLAQTLDERELNPPEAMRFYRLYLQQQPDGWMARRAATRIAALEPYEHVNVELYRRYVGILANADHAQALFDMQKFIEEHADSPLVEDALLWLANATKGPRSRSQNEVERVAARRAIPLYTRILREFPSTRHRLAVLTNLGDAYQTAGDYSRAERYYRAVSEEGGEEGLLLVRESARGARVKLIERRLLFVALGLIPCAILVLARAVSFPRKHLVETIKGGLRHALFALPLAVLATTIAFVVAKPGEGGTSGTEPWFVATCMVALVFFSFANGIILKIDEQKPVRIGLYLPALTVLILTSLYSATYGLNLMSTINRLIG